MSEDTKELVEWLRRQKQTKLWKAADTIERLEREKGFLYHEGKHLDGQIKTLMTERNSALAQAAKLREVIRIQPNSKAMIAIEDFLDAFTDCEKDNDELIAGALRIMIENVKKARAALQGGRAGGD